MRIFIILTYFIQRRNPSKFVAFLRYQSTLLSPKIRERRDWVRVPLTFDAKVEELFVFTVERPINNATLLLNATE